MATSAITSKRELSVKEFNASLWDLFNDGLLPPYQYSTDSNGNVTSYLHTTTNTDANGSSYSSTNQYDANWNLIESAYSDSSGNNSRTQYKNSTDSNGNVTSYLHTTTNSDANGNSNRVSEEYRFTENSTISSIAFESDGIKEIYVLSRNSDYLIENAVAQIAKADLVGITNLIQTDLIII